MAEQPEFVVVLVTVPDEESGTRIAEALVAERLAACVNRVPGVQSVFHWQGEIDRAAEQLLVIKARAREFGRLVARVESLHPYQVPEVLALPVLGGNEGYLAWLRGATSP